MRFYLKVLFQTLNVVIVKRVLITFVSKWKSIWQNKRVRSVKARLKPESLAVFVGDKTIADVTKYSVQEVQEFFSNVELTEKQQK